MVEGSGWGWEHFGLRTAGGAGQLFARKTLDFEDETHRRGFRFMVQVTDRVSVCAQGEQEGKIIVIMIMIMSMMSMQKMIRIKMIIKQKMIRIMIIMKIMITIIKTMLIIITRSIYL